MQSGTIRAGTSADYPPFEAYNDNFQLEGFDIALMQNIAEKLGLNVEFKDMAFDGLGDALAINQIDLAIAAISVTPERDLEVDFSNIYYVTEDAILSTAAVQAAVSGREVRAVRCNARLENN